MALTKEELFAAIPEFVEANWPKNDTAAYGGKPTPGRGEAAVICARFVCSLPEEDEDHEL